MLILGEMEKMYTESLSYKHIMMAIKFSIKFMPFSSLEQIERLSFCFPSKSKHVMHIHS